MSTVNTAQGHAEDLNEPAFPIRGGVQDYQFGGMSLRDYFAAKVIGKTEQRLHPVALERHGYEKARRIGMMAMVGGKDKTRIRNATPPEFRQLLIDIASKCRNFHP